MMSIWGIIRYTVLYLFAISLLLQFILFVRADLDGNNNHAVDDVSMDQVNVTTCSVNRKDSLTTDDESDLQYEASLKLVQTVTLHKYVKPRYIFAKNACRITILSLMITQQLHH
jgi:hypothetical protein